MERSLTSSQMTGLVESLHKHKFDPSITSEICVFVRQRCAANWASPTATPSLTPAAVKPTRAPAAFSTEPANEQDGILTSLASLGVIAGDGEHPALEATGSDDDVLASLANLGAIASD